MDTPPEVMWAVSKLSKVLPAYAYMRETPAEERTSWQWTTASAQWVCSIARLSGPSRRLHLGLVGNASGRYYEINVPVDEVAALITFMYEVGALTKVAVD